MTLTTLSASSMNVLGPEKATTSGNGSRQRAQFPFCVGIRTLRYPSRWEMRPTIRPLRPALDGRPLGLNPRSLQRTGAACSPLRPQSAGTASCDNRRTYSEKGLPVPEQTSGIGHGIKQRERRAQSGMAGLGR